MKKALQSDLFSHIVLHSPTSTFNELFLLKQFSHKEVLLSDNKHLLLCSLFQLQICKSETLFLEILSGLILISLTKSPFFFLNLLLHIKHLLL